MINISAKGQKLKVGNKAVDKIITQKTQSNKAKNFKDVENT